MGDSCDVILTDFATFFRNFFCYCLSISHQASVNVCVRKKKTCHQNLLSFARLVGLFRHVIFFFTIGFLFGWTLISWMNSEFRDWFLRYSKSMTKILYSFIDLWNFTINGLLILLINKNYLTSNNPIYKLINLISSLFKYDFRQIYI